MLIAKMLVPIPIIIVVTIIRNRSIKDIRIFIAITEFLWEVSTLLMSAIILILVRVLIIFLVIREFLFLIQVLMLRLILKVILLVRS